MERMVNGNGSERDAAYMRLAIREAEKAIRTGDVPVGAVMVCEGVVIARAGNTKEKRCLSTRHAEINVIEKAARKLKRWRLSDCTLYVTMEPCIMCAGAIHQARVGRVVYGARDEKHGACGTRMNVFGVEGLNFYPEIEAGVLASECSELLSGFFREIRKTLRKEKESHFEKNLKECELTEQIE